jgi:putative addiction module component (TIGR02574 family)
VAREVTRSSKAAALLREALSLPERDRLALAAALIESVDNGAIRDNVEAAWSFEAKRRLVEVQSGVVKPVPWEDAEKRIFDTE